MRGSPPAIPSLLGIEDRLTRRGNRRHFATAKAACPASPILSDEQMFALVDTSARRRDKELPAAAGAPADEISLHGYQNFLDPDGYPAIVAPVGHA